MSSTNGPPKAYVQMSGAGGSGGIVTTSAVPLATTSQLAAAASSGLTTTSTTPAAESQLNTEQYFSLRWNNYQSNFTSVFHQLLETQAFVDVSLACEEHILQAHKVVLSACSVFFKRILLDNPCKHPTIIMPAEIAYEDLRAIVEFIYRGEIDVPEGSLQSILHTAEQLQIKALSDIELADFPVDIPNTNSGTIVTGAATQLPDNGALHPTHQQQQQQQLQQQRTFTAAPTPSFTKLNVGSAVANNASVADQEPSTRRPRAKRPRPNSHGSSGPLAAAPHLIAPNLNATAAVQTIDQPQLRNQQHQPQYITPDKWEFTDEMQSDDGAGSGGAGGADIDRQTGSNVYITRSGDGAGGSIAGDNLVVLNEASPTEDGHEADAANEDNVGSGPGGPHSESLVTMGFMDFAAEPQAPVATPVPADVGGQSMSASSVGVDDLGAAGKAEDVLSLGVAAVGSDDSGQQQQVVVQQLGGQRKSLPLGHTMKFQTLQPIDQVQVVAVDSNGGAGHQQQQQQQQHLQMLHEHEHQQQQHQVHAEDIEMHHHHHHQHAHLLDDGAAHEITIDPDEGSIIMEIDPANIKRETQLQHSMQQQQHQQQQQQQQILHQQHGMMQQSDAHMVTMMTTSGHLVEMYQSDTSQDSKLTDLHDEQTTDVAGDGLDCEDEDSAAQQQQQHFHQHQQLQQQQQQQQQRQSMIVHIPSSTTIVEIKPQPLSTPTTPVPAPPGTIIPAPADTPSAAASGSPAAAAADIKTLLVTPTPKTWTQTNMDAALESLRAQTMSLTKASVTFGIPSTTLWQRAHRLGIDTPKKEGPSKTWSDDSLNNALEALRNGEISANKASKAYGIPSSTLYKIARREGIRLAAPFNAAPTNWSVDDLERALESIRTGSTSVQKASLEFGIPTGTLYGRCKREGIELSRSNPTPWSEENMMEALESVRVGLMSINQAAIHYNLPYSSLYGRFKRGKFDASMNEIGGDNQSMDQGSENSYEFSPNTSSNFADSSQPQQPQQQQQMVESSSPDQQLQVVYHLDVKAERS